MILDLPPLWGPPKPAIIRPAADLAPKALSMPLTMGMLKPHAAAGIKLVGYASAAVAGAASGNTTLALNSGLAGGSRSAVQADDLVVAVFAVGSTVDRTLSITDGTNAYTLVSSERYANDNQDANLRVAYKFMGSTPDTNTTFGPTGATGDAGVAAVYAFSGVNKTTPLDVAATTATGTNSGIPNPPSITPVTAGAYIMCVGTNAGQWFGTPDFSSASLTDFTNLWSNSTQDCVLGIGLKTDWTSGAFDCPAFSLDVGDSTAASWAALTLALRPA